MWPQGRRLPDLVFGEIHPNIEPGDYWKILNKDGTPRMRPSASNLTGTCWFVVVPLGAGYGLGRLELHTVREHEDGTITVAPNDGSSNSILVSKPNGVKWHGFVEKGVFNGS